MDKHNNEIYKNWYSTNINGKKNLSPTITIPYPPPGNAWCLSRILVAMHQLFFLSAITCSETVVYVFHRKFSEYMYFSY